MSARPLSLHPLRFTPEEIREVVALCAGNPAYSRAADEYDPDDVQAAQVEADLRREVAMEGGEALLARSGEGLVEERFRAAGRSGLRLAVPENNPDALAFWKSLGWRETDRRRDLSHDRPCIVMHKHLA